MRILLTGGGTGGHIFPLIAVKRKIQEKLGADVQFLYVGSGVDLEENAMREEGIPVRHVLTAKLRRYLSFQNFTQLWRLPAGIFQSLWILFRFMPDVVFAKGGFVSVPVAIAAFVYRVPILVHESDAIPGIANQFIAKLSQRIAVSYPSAEEFFLKEKTALIGNPVREDIMGGDAYMFRQKLRFTQTRKTLLILGGSQGSRALNDAVIRVLPQLLQKYQIIHQTGQGNYDDVIHAAATQGIKAGHDGYWAMAFLDANTLRDAYALSDLIISRAGATSIAEIAANRKPSILVPLPSSANDHQRMNAYALAKIGATVVLEESNLGEHMLMQKIDAILSNEELADKLAENITAFYHPHAAEVIAKGIIELGSLH